MYVETLAPSAQVSRANAERAVMGRAPPRWEEGRSALLATLMPPEDDDLSQLTTLR